MKTARELAEVLPALPSISVDRTYARRVALADLLGISGSVPASALTLTVRNPQFLWTSKAAYRFNRDGIEVLYVGEGESAAGAEAKEHPGLAGFDEEPTAPATLFCISVRASRLLDLTSSRIQAALGTREAELIAPWLLRSPNSPTQILGQAIFDAAVFEGIRYRCSPLAKIGEDGRCLALFKARKRPESVVRVFDPSETWDQEW
jgi:hypothetical protein